MKILPLILAATCLASAQNRPIIDVSGGFTFPDISGESDVKEQSSWTLRAGAGIAIPMNPQFDALLTGQFAIGQASGKETDDDYTYELTLVPRYLELDASALFKASPQFGIVGGLVYSIPMGGTYEVEFDAPEYPEESYSDDGDIDDLADDIDADVNNFASLKIGGQYIIDETKSIQLNYLMPLGKYIDTDGFGIKVARLTGGIVFRI